MEFASASGDGRSQLPPFPGAKVADPRLAEEEIIPRVEDVFDRWIFGAIESLKDSPGVSLAFVVIACGIDYLAGFWIGHDAKKKTTLRSLSPKVGSLASIVQKISINLCGVE